MGSLVLRARPRDFMNQGLPAAPLTVLKTKTPV